MHECILAGWVLLLHAAIGRAWSEECASRDKHPGCPGGVDVVYTWVNGSADGHRESAEQVIPVDAFEKSNLEHRFRDYGRASSLLFSLRSVDKHAPWIRHVFIVVADGQRPWWLSDDPSISLVHHSTIFPEWAQQQGALPTFHSCAIEMNLHRIPGLQECFLYLNDDVLLVKDLDLERDLWDPEEPQPFALTNYQVAPFSPRGQAPWGVKLYHVAREISQRTGLARSDILLAGHHGHFFRRSVYNKLVEEDFRKSAERTVLERWRGEQSLWMPMVYSNWAFANLGAKRKRVHARYIDLTDTTDPAEAIHWVAGKHQWLCLNDRVEHWSPSLEASLRSQLERIFVQSSRFERAIPE